ncbi:MAG TPA: class I SAM-dependent methyltransferase [Candidatus Binatia bacterium]|nr:class I SAM-dependent methyltransferase [Candidatus Binatia bacterium]
MSTPDPQLYAILAEAGFGDDLFNPRQHACCELVERYVLQQCIAVADVLGLPARLATATTAHDLAAATGIVTERPLRWLLARLAADGLVVHDGDGWSLPAPLPAPALETTRAEGLALDPSYAPAYALVDEAAALWPRVLRGEVVAERALFMRARLWLDYFSNAHTYYAINNRVAAQAAVARVPAAGAHVLEVGAGLGSATEALLAALAPDVRLAAYDVTEPVAFFRRRTERMLPAAHPDVPFTFDDLDLNQPWAAQGVAAGSRHLVWGVNVFHLAHDLDAVLREAHAALAPGGWLVIGEGIRPGPGVPVGAEFPFQLLESFTTVTLDPVTRPEPGFLTAEPWLAAVARAGFVDTTLVPDVIRLRALYPGFFAGAICGRRG